MHKFSARAVELFEARGLPRKLEVKAAAGDAPAELLIYDAIGGDGYGGGVSASDVVGALAKAGDGPLVVRINSPGGSAFDGLAIYNALKQRGNVTCRVDGIAASAASVIAMAGTLEMPESAMLMIHNAWCLTAGNKNDLAQTAEALGKLDSVMSGIYAAKSGMSPEEVAAMMDAETYMTAAEAKKCGMCDSMMADAAPKKGGKTKCEAEATFAAVETHPVVAAAGVVTDEQRRKANLRLKLSLAE